MQKIIKNDMFNISNRLKKIDKNLYIIFNKTRHRYEVHSKKFKPHTLAFCLNCRLNAYALKKAYLTSPKNARKILKNMNATNAQILAKSQHEFVQKHTETLNGFLNYANGKNCDVTF